MEDREVERAQEMVPLEITGSPDPGPPRGLGFCALTGKTDGGFEDRRS